MNKRVYLFELDSVRTGESDIIRGQRAIINEIAKNGNSVVLTLNQLSDSLAIADLIKNEKTYPYIISLFESGTLCVSLYGNKRTASQYMQQSLDKCVDMDGDKFIFSSLPIKAEDTYRVTLMKNALQYSDLSEITARIEALTAAIADIDEKGQADAQNVKASLETELADMQYVLRYVKLMLTLSVTETSNLPPKATDYTLCKFLQTIRQLVRKRDISHPRWQNGYNSAQKLLDSTEKQMQAEGLSRAQINNRSNWLDRIIPKNETKGQAEAQLTDEQYIAALIVNLAYNYTVEDSISGVSRHYDKKSIADTFKTELKSRIGEILAQDETVYNKKAPTPRAWAGVARIGEYKKERKQRSVKKSAKKRSPRASNEEKIYEAAFLRERIRWEFAMLGRLTRYSVVALFYIILFSAIEYVFSIFEGLASTWFIGLHISEFFTKVIVIILFGFCGSVISGATKMPDIFQCVKNIALYIHDMTVVLGGKYESYRRDK